MSPAKRRRLGYKHDGWGRYVYTLLSGERVVLFKRVDEFGSFVKLGNRTVHYRRTLQNLMRDQPLCVWSDRVEREFGDALHCEVVVSIDSPGGSFGEGPIGGAS